MSKTNEERMKYFGTVVLRRIVEDPCQNHLCFNGTEKKCMSFCRKNGCKVSIKYGELGTKLQSLREYYEKLESGKDKYKLSIGKGRKPVWNQENDLGY